MSEETTDQAPATTESENTNPNVIGQIDPKIVETLKRLQAAARNAQFELGALELRKDQVLTNVKQFQAQMQQLLRQEGTRLDIPATTQWFMDDDGNAVQMGQ